MGFALLTSDGRIFIMNNKNPVTSGDRFTYSSRVSAVDHKFVSLTVLPGGEGSKQLFLAMASDGHTFISEDLKTWTQKDPLKLNWLDKAVGLLNRMQGIVYSTDPDFTPENDHDTVETTDRQNLRVHLDRRKAGKIVTIVKGFIGSQSDLSSLGKSLKKKCGVGGTVKNNEILIQWNVREKVISLLIQEGHIAKPSGG